MAAYIAGHLFGQGVAAIIHGQHHALNLQGRIEAAAYQLNGAHQLRQAFQGEEFALQRHQNSVSGGHGVDRQQIQRGRAVDQHIGEAVLVRLLAEGNQGLAQAERAARGMAQFQLDPRQVRVGRDQEQARQEGWHHRLGQGRLVHQHIINRGGAFLARHAQASGGIALGIKVEDQHALADGRQGGGQIDGGGGFTHAALLVGDGQNA